MKELETMASMRTRLNIESCEVIIKAIKDKMQTYSTRETKATTRRELIHAIAGFTFTALFMLAIMIVF